MKEELMRKNKPKSRRPRRMKIKSGPQIIKRGLHMSMDLSKPRMYNSAYALIPWAKIKNLQKSKNNML